MPPVSTLTAMPHLGSQHLLNTALGTVTPAVPQQQPQCALHMPETQDAWPWKCVFLQSPVSGPGLDLLEGQWTEGQGHRHSISAGAGNRKRGWTSQAGLRFCIWSPGLSSGYLGTIGALCACLPARRGTRLWASAWDHCSRNHGDCPIKSPLCRPDLPSCLSLPCLLHLPSCHGRAEKDENWSQESWS